MPGHGLNGRAITCKRYQTPVLVCKSVAFDELGASSRPRNPLPLLRDCSRFLPIAEGKTTVRTKKVQVYGFRHLVALWHAKCTFTRHDKGRLHDRQTAFSKRNAKESSFS